MGIKSCFAGGRPVTYTRSSARLWLLLLPLVLASPVARAAELRLPTVLASRSAQGLSFEIDGTVQAIRQSTVAAQISGNVMTLAVRAGERVKAGQTLARIDERDSAAALQRSEAVLAQTQAEAVNARNQWERQKELRSKGFISQAALDQAEAQSRSTQAQVQQAQAALKQAGLVRGYATVLAPFDGVVLATHVDQGDLATPGRAIATLYVPRWYRAVVQVGLSRGEQARKASLIEVMLPGGHWVQPLRRSEMAGADPVSQTIEWRLDLPADLPATTLPGQQLRVRFSGVPAAHGDAPLKGTTLRLPASAILRRGELNAVYVAAADGFMLRAVRLGADRGSEGIEILAGLREGERVAIDALRAGLLNARPAP